MKCSNCGFDYLISSSYCPKCGENNSEYNYFNSTKNSEAKNIKDDVSDHIYHHLIEKVKTLFDASLWDGDSDINELIDYIDEQIEEHLGDGIELKDYVLFHDNWKDRDRFFYMTHRRSYVLIHREFSEEIKNLIESETTLQDPGEYLYQTFDSKKLDDAYAKNLITKTGEIHPLGYTEWPQLITSSIETYDYSLEDITPDSIPILNSYKLTDKEKLERILYLNQFKGEEINIKYYDVLYIDEFYRSDSYIFIPLDKKYTKDEIENNMKFVNINESKLLLGVYFNNVLYKRKDQWMSFNDRELNQISLVSLEEFIQFDNIEE